jgi:transcriptional regulator with XRE-family HTH domain
MLLAELAKWIERSNLSRYEIAKRAKVDHTSLSRFMNGKGSLSIQTIDKLCHVLKLVLLPAKLVKENEELRDNLLNEWEKGNDVDLQSGKEPNGAAKAREQSKRLATERQAALVRKELAARGLKIRKEP